jgi:hypothetical protein
MQRNTQQKHSHRKHHSAAADMATHAGIEGLLASIPAALMASMRHTVGENVQQTLRSVMDKGEKAAQQAVSEAANGRFKMSAPVVVGAVIVGAALVHGALRGKRKHEERSFRDAEDERRAQRGQAGGYDRASA